MRNHRDKSKCTFRMNALYCLINAHMLWINRAHSFIRSFIIQTRHKNYPISNRSGEMGSAPLSAAHHIPNHYHTECEQHELKAKIEYAIKNPFPCSDVCVFFFIKFNLYFLRWHRAINTRPLVVSSFSVFSCFVSFFHIFKHLE